MAKQLDHALFGPSYKRKQRSFECPNCFSNMIKFRFETDLPPPNWRPFGQVECAFCGTIAEIKASEKGIEVCYHGKGLYSEEFLKRLAEWHETSIKSFALSFFVIPAKAGIQQIEILLDSCFRRGDTFSEFLRDHQRFPKEG